MASTLPRVTVYLQPDTHAALSAAADALGQSRSSIAAELLDAAVPMFEAVRDAALVVQRAPRLQRVALSKAAEDLERLKASLDDVQGSVLEMIRKAADAADDPRPVTRGSES